MAPRSHRGPRSRSNATTKPTARLVIPETIDSRSVIHTPAARKRQLAVMTPKSKSTGLDFAAPAMRQEACDARLRGAALRRAERDEAACAPLLHRLDNPDFILLEL